MVDCLNPPPDTQEIDCEGVTVHVRYQYDPENRLGSRLVRSVDVTGVFVRGVDIKPLVDPEIIERMSTAIEESINK
jgi:hypothetical protein